MTARVPLLSLALAALLASSTAHADVVGPAPKSCPRGAMPRSDHGGPYCSPSTCEKAADCPGQTDAYPRPSVDDFSCKAGVKLCMKKLKVAGGWGDFDRDTAYGACTTDDDCSDGAQCVAERRCVLGESPESPPASLPSAPPGGATAGRPDGTARSGPSAQVEVRDTDRTVPTASGKGCGACSVSQEDDPRATFAALIGVGLLAWRRRTTPRGGRRKRG